MGKLIKFLFGLVLVLVLLVVAAIVIVPLVVDPNDFRDDIVAQVKKATGRDLAIDGDIGLSVFPWLGVELGGLALSQPPGFGDEPFAAVERAQVRVKLMPLLKQRLEVDTVMLKGLRLALIRSDHGVANWEDLAAGAAGEGRSEPAEASEPKGPAIAGFAIGGIDVSDARVSWDDRQTGQAVAIQDLNLTTGRVVPGEPVDLDLNFVVDKKRGELTARVRLQGRVTPGDGGQLIQVAPFELRLAEVTTAGGLRGEAMLTAIIALDLKAQRHKIDDMRLQAKAQGGPIPGGPIEGSLTAALDLDLARETLALSGLNLQAAGVDLSADLNGSRIRTAPVFSGKLGLKQFDLTDVMQRFGVPAPLTTDPQVLKRIALTADLNAGPQQAALENLNVTFDDSKLDGKARIVLGAAPAYRFDLKLDAIDLDRYLPPPQEQPVAAPESRQAPQQPASAATPAPAAEQALFPVDLLRQLDVNGSFHIGHLVVNKLKLDDVSVQLKAKNGDLTVNQKVNRFYQGSLGGALGLDVKGKNPQIRVDQRVTGIQAQPLVQDLSGQDRFTGTGNFNLKLTGSGQTVGAIKRSLDGNLDFAFTEGTVKGFNLGRQLREAAARLKGQSLPPDQEANQTDFSQISATAVIANGVLRNDDFNAKSPLFRVTGAGTVNIGENSLDYKVKPVLVASLKGQGGEDLERLKGVPIPVHLTGPLNAPNWRIDLAEALTESQKARVKEKLNEEIQKKLPKDIQDQLPGGLKGLFN